MSKTVYYRQCRLRKKHTASSYSEQTSYIPEPFCVKGKVLKLKDEDGVWDDGWVVVEASENRVDETPDLHKDIRGHRKTTGDSMPK